VVGEVCSVIKNVPNSTSIQNKFTLSISLCQLWSQKSILFVYADGEMFMHPVMEYMCFTPSVSVYWMTVYQPRKKNRLLAAFMDKLFLYVYITLCFHTFHTTNSLVEWSD